MKSLPTVQTDPSSDAQNLVYVRKLALEEARKIVPADTFEILAAPENLFSVHSASGERLAIVEGREAAFAAARAYDLRPRSVH